MNQQNKQTVSDWQRPHPNLSHGVSLETQKARNLPCKCFVSLEANTCKMNLKTPGF